MIRLLIVEDENLVRQGLEYFCSLNGEIEVVATAGNGREAVEKAKQYQPEVILMDVFMPEMDGIQAATTLKKELPSAKILMLSGLLNRETVNRSVRAGAVGFIFKNIERDELCRSIKAATNGIFIASAEVARYISNQTASAHANIENILSQREVEVLKLVAQGKANKEIAYTLNLSEGTIKTHISVILAKIGMQSRTQAALYASESGLI